MTRRHHPLQGREFEVVADGRLRLCIRLNDGSPMYIQRRWTDADGPPDSLVASAAAEAVFTVESLRDLGELVAALLDRR